MDRETILILDFGAQYSQLIARRVRENNVYSRILPHDTAAKTIEEIKPAGIILSGGPQSVTTPEAPKLDQGILELGIPVLGICYGMHIMAAALPGGIVEKAEHGEYGKARLQIRRKKGMLEGVDNNTQVWMSHKDHVKRLPHGFEILGSTEITPVAVMQNPQRDFYGVQFHPEVIHTLQGRNIIHNFLFKVCQVKANWTMADYIEESVNRIREEVGQGQVICGLSGGVDSSVASAMVHRAIGDQLTCIFVDHGLLRKGEGEQVKRTFKEEFNIPLVYVDARERFLTRLEGVADPEEKRRIIG
ncbi:MAG: glutamine-hydrolyzing GMP synthase, partial [Bacillota bacterium]